MNKLIIFFCCILFSANSKAQKSVSLSTVKNMISKIDTATIETYRGNNLYNAKVLESIFAKLKENETTDNLYNAKVLESIFAKLKENETTNNLYNAKVLESIFAKLKENETTNNQKINIVHIGDSHIQEI